MDANADTGSDATAGHPLRMSGRGAFYSFSFDLGPDLDFVKLANKLLKKNMATVAVSPSRKGHRIGSRLLDTQRHHRDAEKTGEFFDILYSGDAIIWRRLFRLNWKLTLKILWLARRIVAPFLVRRILLGQGPRSDVKTRPQPEDIPEDIRENQKVIAEAVAGYEKHIWDQHALGAMRVRLEQQMYFPRYYSRSEPFIRLELNRAYYSDASHQTEPIEISMMIHRSGTCVLTLATPIAREFGVDEGYEYLQAGARMLDEVELSLPFVRRHHGIPKGIVKEFRSAEVHDGLEWVVLNAERLQSKPTMLSVFLTYLGAVEKLAGRYISIEGTEWRCNTTLFQGTPRCGCNGAEAKERHAVEFAQLMVRCPAPMPVTDDVRQELLKNYLMNSDRELWLGPGSAIHTFWERDKIDYLADIQTVIPIESAILQYRQLEAIDHRTVNVAIRDRDLFAAQKQLATGLPEYGRNLMPDMNAPEVVDGLAAKLKTPQLYSRLNDRVKVLESVVNTRYSRRQSRRSLSISFIGLVIVVLLLLPRIKELIDKLGQLTPTQSIVKWVSDSFGSSDRAVVAIYVVAIAVTALVFVAMAVRFPVSRLRWRRRNFGYRSDREIHVTRGPGTLPGGVEGSTSDEEPPATESEPPAG